MECASRETIRWRYWYLIKKYYTLHMQSIFLYWREVFSFLAVSIALYSYWSYIRTIFRGKTEPHVFSWGIWAFTTGIAFFAQVAGGWWWGTAQNGITFVVCIFIALLAGKYWQRGKFHILDWCSLLLSLFAIGLWWITKNPFYGSLFAMLADSIGYIPTFRKVWKKPESEPSWYYLLMNLKHGLSLLSLSVYTWTTMIFSGSVIIINFLLIFIQYLRRNK